MIVAGMITIARATTRYVRRDGDKEGRRRKRKQEIFKRRWMKCWIASREIDSEVVIDR